jgi:hypothetical protein
MVKMMPDLIRKFLRLRSDLHDYVLLSGGRVSATYQGVSVGIEGFTDEDVYAAN